MNDLLGGIFLVALVVFGALFLTSNAVLVSESQTVPTPNLAQFRYECSYFTGTRVIHTGTDSPLGCARLVKINGGASTQTGRP